MRIIKFRAWDKKEHKWLFGYELPNLGGFSMFGEIMLMGEWTALLSSRFPDELEEIEVTQYTGLKDKNGKEIYESDIVYAEEYVGLKKLKAEVVYNRARFCLNTGTIPEDLIPELCGVIGNIYENPELLTNKDT